MLLRWSLESCGCQTFGGLAQHCAPGIMSCLALPEKPSEAAALRLAVEQAGFGLVLAGPKMTEASSTDQTVVIDIDCPGAAACKPAPDSSKQISPHRDADSTITQASGPSSSSAISAKPPMGMLKLCRPSAAQWTPARPGHGPHQAHFGGLSLPKVHL